MGREARCPVRVRDAAGAEHTGEARTLLESEELIVSGPAKSGLKARVPRAGIRDVSESDGVVHVRWDDGAVDLELGPDAAAWAKALREPPKPVIDKLGVKPGMTVSVRGLDDADLLAQIEARAERVVSGRFAAHSDIVLLAARTPGDLEAIPRAVAALVPNGALWVVHPRGVPEVADTVIFAAGRAAGLVATKVARINATMTAEMLVRPKADRQRRA